MTEAGAMTFVIFIAVANLCLGYATAVYFGHGPGRRLLIEDAALPDAIAPVPDHLTEEFATSETAESPVPAPNLGDPATSVEESIRQLKLELTRYRKEVLRCNEWARDVAESPTVDDLKEVAVDLTQANREYLQQRAKALEQMDRDAGLSDEIAAVGEQVQADCNGQAEEIEASLEELDGLVIGRESLAEDRQKIVAQTGKLVQTCHRMGGVLDGALLEIARHEDRVDRLDMSVTTDDQTELLNRTGLIATVQRWWEDDPDRSRELSIGMVHLDQFSELNRRCGPAVADRILQFVSQTVSAERREGGDVARVSGQQFVLTLPEEGPRETCDTIERIRQKIEKTRFEHKGDAIRTTVSCAVVEVRTDDTIGSLFSRLESTIQEAKRYGRNRTFLYEGEYPAPVAPPALAIEETVVTV